MLYFLFNGLDSFSRLFSFVTGNYYIHTVRNDAAVYDLQMLDAFKFVDCAANHSFLMDTQDQIVGGFSKWPDHTPGTAAAQCCVCVLIEYVLCVSAQSVMCKGSGRLMYLIAPNFIKISHTVWLLISLT